ncbi:FGGY-family carbohydrate kinase [Mesoterricola sediminis]|uniref:Carbohydrate kinase n=1 Tax=Mesoterricola sediminis TaxID=2927980 RepID=A0AA48KAX2_9BACT|nr:FGGY-family carbohydrate kinase [Mesoterricola sediminis]BDU75514.1 carbohydrate kinase [Mesoterricola sediminis]
MPDTLLALDCGTQSLRAMIFSADGRLLHKVKVEYEPYVSPRPGWAEQDPELYWRSLCEAVAALKAEAGEAFAAVRGVGVTTQRDTLVFLDREGRVLRPALTWLDTRKARAVYRPAWWRALAYRAVGMLEAIQKTQKEGKANWVRQNQPEIWDATAWVLQVSGFLNQRLTGLFRDSVANQIGHIPFNYKKMRWCRKGELAALLFPIPLERLPELVPAGTPLGAVTEAAARATGLPQGLPVIACASDKGAETIGIGCVGPDMASLSLGTTATVQTTTPRYVEPIRFMPPYPAAVPGHYNPEVEIFRGYWMISWFKRELAPQDVQEALARGVAPEALLDRHLREVPPGSMGLVTLPHWGPSLKLPGTKGAMVGFGDVHTRGHLYRSVLEGLAYGLREGLEKIERRSGVRIRRIGISGGATQSGEICQLTADILGRELTCGETFETAGLGAAVLTAAGVGLHPGIPAAVAAMVRHGRAYAPRPEVAGLYDRLYRRVYLRLYGRLSPLYREIRAIVNYPERAADEVP